MRNRDVVIRALQGIAEHGVGVLEITGQEEASEILRALTTEDDLVAALKDVADAVRTTLVSTRHPEPQAAPPPPLARWARVEMMGHRDLGPCWVEEDEFLGRKMLRIQRIVRARDVGNVPIGTPTPILALEEVIRTYSPAAVYSIEWLADEQEARERWLDSHGHSDDIPF